MQGTLYIVATPIGNLADITSRALDVLKSVDMIACEDTRVTAKLLTNYKISKPLLIYNEHKGLERVLKELELGKDLAYVTDAGTPGISDPGAFLVHKAIERKIDIVPIPGPSAVAAALSASGFRAEEFVFLGFPPHKKGRETFFKKLAEEPRTIVLYESTHRIEKALESMAKVIPDRKIALFRELTKKFETTYRGKPSEVLEQLKTSDTRGEFVIVIAPFG